jgi:immune inhibitor A
MIRAALAAVVLLALTACSDTEPGRTSVPATASPVPPMSVAAVRPAPVATGGAQRAPASAVDLEPQVPIADPYDLARRLRRVDAAALSSTQPPAATVGDTRRFYVIDLNETKALEISATLLAQTDHADLWVQDGQRISRTDAEKGGRQFEDEVFGTVTEAFGYPAPAPGGAPGRIAILHFALQGASGYFAGSDGLPRALVPFSNEQQIIYIDAARVRPGSAGYPGLVAHEFQHLVHQQINPNADTWLNEGLSELANEQVSRGGSFLRRFETAPDTQLNYWPANDNTAAHYGAAHSFLRYLLSHYGGVERAKDLIAQAATGVNSVERYLRLSGFDAGFLDVFADWTIANLLDQPGDGRYSQPGIEHRIRSIEKLPTGGRGEGSVHQFGTDYLELTPDGSDLTLHFDGAERTPRVNVTPVSGRAFWWSNRADSMDSTLTREFDLTGVRSATLRFKLWFAIEQDYDYAYVLASRDGGRTWQPLRGRYSTERDPLKIAYGPGYSGVSGGGDSPVWVDEQIDLSAFAGGRVLLRFEYVTDEGAVEDGLAIDDLSIAEIGFVDDVERDNGWQADGFLRVDDTLPQRFIVQLVEEAADGGVSVRRIDLDAHNDADIPVSRAAKRATLVVSGATLGATEPARYQWEVRR